MKRCCFDGTMGLLLPLDARGKGRRFFLPCFSPLPPSPKPQKDGNTISPLAYHVVEEGRGRTPWAVRGDRTEAAPATYPLDRGSRGSPPPSVLPINTEGGGKLKKGTKKGEKRKKKKGEEGRTRETREHKRGENRERKKEKKGKKKKRRERKKDEKPYWPPQSLHRATGSTATGSTASTPPQVTSCCPVLFPLAQPLPAFACRT